MPNAIYPKWKQAIVQATANSSLGGTVKVALVDLGLYTYAAAHEFYSSVTGVAGTPPTLASKTYVDGLFDAADSIIVAVPSGPNCEALIIYIDTGVAGTSRLVAFFDTGVTGLPVTPNGGDINITWNASGIFQL